MEIRLAYGNEGITLDVPDGIDLDRYGLTAVERPITFEQFSTSVRGSGFNQFLGADRILVVVNDAYRSTPTPRILGWLRDLDASLLDRCDFLIAAGTHAAPTQPNLDTIFGSLRSEINSRISWHDARDLTAMRSVGRDADVHEVFLNRQYLDAAAVLVIGSVEPHYFAGYTGGRKSLFPGLSDLATTERNHNLANSLEAQPLRLAGNPLAENLERLLDLIDTSKVFSIQVVQDAGGRIDSVYCGKIRDSFKRSLNAANRLFAHTADRPYDVVIAELRPPLDRNLYQAQKALENTQMAVRDGGSVLVVSQCPEGIGAPHYLALAEEWDRERNEARDGVRRFGSHKLSRVNLMTRRIGVRLYSEVLPDDALKVFYDPVDSMPTWVGENIRSDTRVAVVYDAGNTVLQLNDTT